MTINFGGVYANRKGDTFKLIGDGTMYGKKDKVYLLAVLEGYETKGTIVINEADFNDDKFKFLFNT